MKKSLTTAALCVALGALSAGPALAGEVTGSGKKENQNQGRSWCSFSGLNDDPTAPLDGSGPNGPGGRSQSFGQENKLGISDPHTGNPGHVLQPEPDTAAPAAEPDEVARRPRRDKRGLSSGREGLLGTHRSTRTFGACVAAGANPQPSKPKSCMTLSS